MMDFSLHAILQSVVCLSLAFICICRGNEMKGKAKRVAVLAYAAIFMGACWCALAPWPFLIAQPWELPYPVIFVLAGMAGVLGLGAPAWQLGLPAHLRR